MKIVSKGPYSKNADWQSNLFEFTCDCGKKHDVIISLNNLHIAIGMLGDSRDSKSIVTAVNDVPEFKPKKVI